jgi:hypothetical protein
MKRKHYPLLVSALALFSPSSAIPYTPTSIFLSPQHNDSLAYILRPSPTGETEFLSLNLSTNINADNLSYTTLLNSTPFSTDQNSTFTPAIDDQGLITVYAGDCHAAGHPALWQFHPDTNSSLGNGTWNRLSVTVDKNGETAPNFLAAGFTYSSSHANESSMYTFAGMCPFANSTDETWIDAANYSRSTVVLAQSPYYSNKYTAAITGDRAPPVAEAGMTVVPLQATYSSGSPGKQQDFLFIGGHTRQAFLNMSQLAIFSLPQQSWSFVSASGQSSTKNELAIRDEVDVEPRSGHTAVLSKDGNKVFVLGGWVGDTSVPADPQFAVLELAEGFGGATEWVWTTPDADGLGISEGSGIFGHGAVMLPGDVMMISGGYNIAKQSTKRAVANTNSQVYLYNVTSNSWVTSYSNPAATSQSASSTSSNKLSTSQKAGLGVGLGIGCPAAMAIALFAWNHYRKRRVKGQRDSQLRELALGAERAHFWGREDPNQASSIRSSGMGEKGGPPVFPWSASRSQPENSKWNDQGDTTAERTGLLRDIPSPTKNSPPPAPANPRSFSNRYSEYQQSDATRKIHPIDEREEDEAIFRARLMATIPESQVAAKMASNEDQDPFSDTPYATPRSTIFGVGLGPFYSRRKDMGPADAESPTKSERTTTDLSESSHFSFSSSQPTGPTGRVLQAKAIITDRPYSWGSGRHSLENLTAASTHSDPDGVAPSEKSSADSYSTAQTTLSHRQAEQDSLLFDQDPIQTEPGSPSKLSRDRSRPASGWVMSTMRRALTMSRRPDVRDSFTTTSSGIGLASGIDRRSTLSGQQPPPSGSPRRTVSASAELFRRKQGAKDWNAKCVSDDLFRDAPGYLGNDAFEEEDDYHDWDLEGTAEGRRVQMAFTVPREKLRVVNATAGDLDNVSERSISRPGSRRVST